MAKRKAVKRAKRLTKKQCRSVLKHLKVEAERPVSTPDYTPPAVSDDELRRWDMDMVNFWRSIKFTPNFRPQTVLNDERQPRQTSDRRSPNRTLSAMNDRRKGERRKTSA